MSSSPTDRCASRVTAFALALFLGMTQYAFAQTDPLPSWNETPVKQALLDFARDATTEEGPGFIPPDERIAVFDMDGTLIPEKPIPLALIPVLDDIQQAVAAKPELAEKPAVAALLKGDEAALHAAGEQGINDLIAVATDGRTTEDIVQNVRSLVDGKTSARFDVPYSRAVYQPMREVIALLEANGFTIWICSGSPLLITRELSQEMFGIPPERVMGSYVGTRLDEQDGKTVLVFDGTIARLNDGEGKPVTINLAIGQRPAFVGGNEGGRGDIAMMRWSMDRDGPSFQLLVNHDDESREFAYSEPDNYSLNAAKEYGFHVVSIRDDWKTIIDRK
ncbi:haloacid dehalogenase-like hydrolase [Aureimonas fodinaquatilis]|uniref:Haloacid dehalogenase-like hydrolase n=1 Tax=Aureimonas fodinaquatilis TaxID=2565783 RepID=A0A5B0DS86_9HYPH|nr:haloacid dehalogenase-like hydrolase [Aureimonas fodinaquatilis]KAA0969366.1 haloacid dehalogenase-like hydrolase [Aureimonas fodinaquatilis]